MKKQFIVLTTLVFTGCVPGMNQALLTSKSPLKLLEIPSLSLQVKIQTPTPKMNVPQLETKGFGIKLVDPTDIFHGNGFVTGNGIAVPIPPSGPANPFLLPRGTSNVDVTFTPVPVGNNRVVTVTGLDMNQNAIAGHYEIKGVANVISPGPNSVTVSVQTTPTARVIEKLIADAHATANTIDYTTIQTLVDRLVDNNTGGNPLDDIHPSLVNHNAIAAYIEANGVAPVFGVTGSRALHAFTPGTISGTISGAEEPYLLGAAARTVFPPFALVANDWGSSVVTIAAQNLVGSVGSINYSITNVSPGTGYSLTVQPAYHNKQVATGITVNPGATTNQDIVFGAGDKRHWFQEAITGTPVSQVKRYQGGQPLDVLIIKPSDPASTAVDWNNTHLDATKYAIEQLKTLYGDALTIGQVDEVFDNNANFGVTPLPAIGSSFSPSPGNILSPNHPSNLNINLVGKYDLYIRWTTNVVACPASTIGICRSTWAGATTYTTIVELSTYTCGGTLIGYETMRELTAHELTHALGGTNHSSVPTDVMFPSTNLSQPLNLNPSINDINTVRFLYNATPTIVNTNRTP